jgi:hypothetical protein
MHFKQIEWRTILYVLCNRDALVFYSSDMILRMSDSFVLIEIEMQ